MGASAIRFENWLPQTTNSGVQWWPSPPAPGSEPATTEPQKPDAAKPQPAAATAPGSDAPPPGGESARNPDGTCRVSP